MALGPLEDQVRRHQPWCQRSPRQVVDRLGTMTQCVQQPKHVDCHVGEVAPAIIDDEVQVHVIGRSKASARQRTRNRDAANERSDADQSADEEHGHLQVRGGVSGVGRGPRPDGNGARSVRAQNHQILCKGQLRRGGDGPANVLLRKGSAQARARQPPCVERKASAREEGGGSPDPLRRGRGLGWRMADHRSASHNRTAHQSDTTPGY